MDKQLSFLIPDIQEFYQCLKNAKLSPEDIKLIELATQMAIAYRLGDLANLHNLGE